MPTMTRPTTVELFTRDVIRMPGTGGRRLSVVDGRLPRSLAKLGSAPKPTTLARPVAVKAQYSEAELASEVSKLFGIGRSRFHESRFAKR